MSGARSERSCVTTERNQVMHNERQLCRRRCFNQSRTSGRPRTHEAWDSRNGVPLGFFHTRKLRGRCFHCGKDNDYGQCPCKTQQKTKGGHTALAEIAEDASQGHEQYHLNAHEAYAVSMSQAGIGESTIAVFDSGATHILLERRRPKVPLSDCV